MASPTVIDQFTRCAIRLELKDDIKLAADEFLASLPDELLQNRLKVSNGEYDEARAMLEAMASIEDEHQEYPRLAALVYLHDENYAKATENVLKAAKMFPRSKEVYEIALEVFEASKDDERLAIAKQNLDRINDLHSQRIAVISDLKADIESPEPRQKLSEISVELGSAEAARQWNRVIEVISPETKTISDDEIFRTVFEQEPFYPFESSDEESDSAPESDSASESDSAPESDSTAESADSEETSDSVRSE